MNPVLLVKAVKAMDTEDAIALLCETQGSEFDTIVANVPNDSEVIEWNACMTGEQLKCPVNGLILVRDANSVYACSIDYRNEGDDLCYAIIEHKER